MKRTIDRSRELFLWFWMTIAYRAQLWELRPEALKYSLDDHGPDIRSCYKAVGFCVIQMEAKTQSVSVCLHSYYSVRKNPVPQSPFKLKWSIYWSSCLVIRLRNAPKDLIGRFPSAIYLLNDSIIQRWKDRNELGFSEHWRDTCFVVNTDTDPASCIMRPIPKQLNSFPRLVSPSCNTHRVIPSQPNRDNRWWTHSYSFLLESESTNWWIINKNHWETCRRNGMRGVWCSAVWFNK